MSIQLQNSKITARRGGSAVIIIGRRRCAALKHHARSTFAVMAIAALCYICYVQYALYAYGYAKYMYRQKGNADEGGTIRLLLRARCARKTTTRASAD